MRREISILLLCCFACYHFGFYIFYFSSRYKIEADWNTEIFEGQLGPYPERLVEIPLSFPYTSEQEEFQLSNVSFEENGYQFRVIKQRYVNGTLQIIFVPDVALGKLDQTLKNWMGALMDGNQRTDQSQALVWNLIKDYFFTSSYIKFSSAFSKISNIIVFWLNDYQNVSIDLTTPPPEVS